MILEQSVVVLFAAMLTSPPLDATLGQKSRGSHGSN